MGAAHRREGSGRRRTAKQPGPTSWLPGGRGRNDGRGEANLHDGWALVEQLLGLPQFADDLQSFEEDIGYGAVAVAFQGLLQVLKRGNGTPLKTRNPSESWISQLERSIGENLC